MKKLVSFILLFVFAAQVNATGKITSINFSGPQDGTHPNIVQIKIEGGFNVTGCDPDFAAIRVTPESQHLVSFALAAYFAEKPVQAVLTGDKYYGDRCTIIRLSGS